MAGRIAIIDGHPDPDPKRFMHALAAAYEKGARAAGHEVRSIAVAKLYFPQLRTAEDFQKGEPPEIIRRCQEIVLWADHVVILYPLWLGDMPSLLKAFFEQVFRPGFGFKATLSGRLPHKLLRGKSARIVVTMGMPAFFYRWFFRAHSLRSLKRNILSFCGMGPIRTSLIGRIDRMGSAPARERLLAKFELLGRKAR